MEFTESNLNTSDTSIKKRVAVYCKVGILDSIPQIPSFLTQQRYFLDYVRRHPDLHIVAMYCDDERFPSLKSNGFKTLLEDAEAEKFDLILMKSMDSFTSSLKIFLQIVEHLLHLPKPVGIIFKEEYLNTLDPRNEHLLRILRTVAKTFNNDKEMSCQYLEPVEYLKFALYSRAFMKIHKNRIFSCHQRDESSIFKKMLNRLLDFMNRKAGDEQHDIHKAEAIK